MENMDKGLTVPKWVLIVWQEIPQMPQNLSAQAQKFWISRKKKLHWASVVRASVENSPSRTRSLNRISGPVATAINFLHFYSSSWTICTVHNGAKSWSRNEKLVYTNDFTRYFTLSHDFTRCFIETFILLF